MHKHTVPNRLQPRRTRILPYCSLCIGFGSVKRPDEHRHTGWYGLRDAHAQDMERVFEPFVRLEAARSIEKGGVGLGMTIVHSIVRGHGGDITLTKRPEGGLRVAVRVPTVLSQSQQDELPASVLLSRYGQGLLGWVYRRLHRIGVHVIGEHGVAGDQVRQSHHTTLPEAGHGRIERGLTHLAVL